MRLPGMRAGKKSKLKRSLSGSLALVLPSLFIFLLFELVPVIYSFYLSFTDWTLGRTAHQVVGLGNFKALGQDLELRQAVLRTGKYSLFTAFFSALGGIVLALLLRGGRRERPLSKTVLLIPSIVPFVVIASLWTWIYDPYYGIANWLLSRAGVAGPAWLTSPRWALTALIIMAVWREMGYNALILLAGLGAISGEVLESSLIDGCTKFQSWIYIVLPLLKNSLFFVLAIQIIRGFEVFGPIYTMTGGGPAKATTTMVYYMYQKAFQSYQVGYGAAVSWVIVLITFFFFFMIWKGFRGVE